MRFLTFLTPLFASVLFAQTAPTANQLAQKLTSLHDAWGVRASSPNVKLAIVEQSHVGAEFRYRLQATGIPAGSVFTLFAWPVTQREPAEVLRGVTFNDVGIAVCAGRPGTCGDAAKPNDPIDIPFRPIAGQPVRLGIVSQDGAVKAFAKIVPLPLEGEDKGCRVSATLLTPGAELVLVEGTGFAPNSELTMAMDSEGEKHDAKGKVDEHGRYISALMPYKQGLARGTVSVRLKGGGCSPSVSVPWGKRQ
ncbi:MAG TPA: hypothetical protein VG675_14750 [Bryobacteraceae bacterium]|nr:hypothetical protein [Bryobacteraceae bacterium]